MVYLHAYIRPCFGGGVLGGFSFCSAIVHMLGGGTPGVCTPVEAGAGDFMWRHWRLNSRSSAYKAGTLLPSYISGL